MPPEAYAAPQVVISRVGRRQLIPNLTSLVVHVSAARATAEAQILGRLDDMPSNRAAIEAERLAVVLPPQEEIFSGWLTGVETRVLPAIGHATALFSAGTGPLGSSRPSVPLRFGAEVESGSVRRRAQGLTAQCTTSARGLLLGSRIDLTTFDPEFDGTFEVVEIWYRFDATDGLRVEFKANG